VVLVKLRVKVLSCEYRQPGETKDRREEGKRGEKRRGKVRERRGEEWVYIDVLDSNYLISLIPDVFWGL
jgi:hypothetical protein